MATEKELWMAKLITLNNNLMAAVDAVVEAKEKYTAETWAVSAADEITDLEAQAAGLENAAEIADCMTTYGVLKLVQADPCPGVGAGSYWNNIRRIS